MNECKMFREEIEVSAAIESLSLEAGGHVVACHSCSELRRKSDALSKLVSGLGKVDAPADFDMRLRARMRTARFSGGKYGFLRPMLSTGLAWAAAACILAVSATLYYQHEPEKVGIALKDNERIDSSQRARDVVEANTLAENVPEKRKAASDGSQIQIATLKSVGVSRRAAPRRPFLRVSRREPSREVASANASEFTFTSAPILRLKIPINTSPESLRFVVRDERGNTRPVPLRAVSFGSQDFIAGANTRSGAAQNDKGGVW